MVLDVKETKGLTEGAELLGYEELLRSWKGRGGGMEGF